MPQTPSSFAFEGQSLKGMELDVKLETDDAAHWACIFAATAFDVQVAAATTSRQHTLNKGSRTSTGAAGEITATCDVFVVPDSPGQYTINEAFRTGAKVNIRRCTFGAPVGGAVTLSATNNISIAAAPTGAVTGKTTPKSGGLVTVTDATGATGDSMRALEAAARPGMTLKVGTNYYFIGYVADGTPPQIYISPQSVALTETNRAFPYIGGARTSAEVGTTGTAQLYRGRSHIKNYTGTVTVPVVATDAAPGDDGNDLSTAQISFALDDIGQETFGADPS